MPKQQQNKPDVRIRNDRTRTRASSGSENRLSVSVASIGLSHSGWEGIIARDAAKDVVREEPDNQGSR